MQDDTNTLTTNSKFHMMWTIQPVSWPDIKLIHKWRWLVPHPILLTLRQRSRKHFHWEVKNGETSRRFTWIPTQLTKIGCLLRWIHSAQISGILWRKKKPMVEVECPPWIQEAKTIDLMIHVWKYHNVAVDWEKNHNELQFEDGRYVLWLLDIKISLIW